MSQAIAVVLLIAITVILISGIAATVLATTLPDITPQAKIVAVEATGDTDVELYKNKISLRHKGGDNLLKNKTKIILRGKGYTYTTGTDPHLPAHDVQITYMDLSGDNYGGNFGFNLGDIVDGVAWDAGEQIELYGKDGRNIGLIMGQGNTVDCKWKLKAGTEVRVTLIDISTNQVIATSTITVKHS